MEMYDRNGRPIDMATFNQLLMDYAYRCVALTTVGPYVVSTVWLGLDHGWGRQGGPPVIFETMVFAADDWEGDTGRLREFDMTRYCTEGEAEAGHEATVLLVRATLPDWETLLHDTEGTHHDA